MSKKNIFSAPFDVSWLHKPVIQKLLTVLQSEGAEVFAVGGCVRDSLTGITPKDFDVATTATPDQVRRIFKSSRIIGRRFKLVHLYSHNELIEIATFRAGKNSLLYQ